MRQIQTTTHDDSRRAGLFGLVLLVLATFALVSLTACGGGSAPADPAVEQGKAVFARLCATCHGQDANGLPKLGKGLRSNAFTESLSDAELIDFIKQGRSAGDPLNETGIDMPPKGGDPSLTDEDLKAVVAFLRTL